MTLNMLLKGTMIGGRMQGSGPHLGNRRDSGCIFNAERLKARLSRALNLVWLVGFG